MPAQETILVVDDDREIRTLLGEYLGNAGYRVQLAGDGTGLFKTLNDATIDLIVLDIMLPGEDGVSLCRRLRQMVEPLARIPVLMLTALSEPIDRILGLEIGADDYLVKPFVPRELLARIRTVMRRIREIPLEREAPSPKVLKFDRFTIDLISRDVYDETGQRIALTSGEYRLLTVFLRHPNRVLSRDQLLDLTQGRDASPFDRGVDVVISRLRTRLRDGGDDRRLIKTVRGEGYVLTVPVRTSSQS